MSVQFGGVCEHPRPFGTAMPPDKQKSGERVNLFKRIGGVTQKILIRRGQELSKMASQKRVETRHFRPGTEGSVCRDGERG